MNVLQKFNRTVLEPLSWGQWLIIVVLLPITLIVILPYFWMLFVSITAGDTGSVNVAAIKSILQIFLPFMLVFFAVQFLVSEPAIRRILTGLVLVFFGLITILLNASELSLISYKFLINSDGPSVYHSLFNSLLLATGQTLIVCVCATCAGYYLSRFNFTGRSGFMKGLVVLHAFPALTLIIPIFLLLHWSHLLDSLTGVVMVLGALELPFAIFLMKGFFDAVPWDIEMSAMTDGASRIQAFTKVVLPLVKNGIIAIAVLSFLKGWEEYIFVTSFIFDSQYWVMSQYLNFYAEDSMGADYGMLTAVACVYLLPSLLLYISCQKYLSQISVAGSKG